MHRCFESDDIIYAVLEHVKSSGTDLVNVAMTCTRLAGPALNILWSEQSSLGPLIMCLPKDTWEITRDRIINFRREPSPIEWDRLSLNASRVRRLVADRSGHAFFPQLQPSDHVIQRLFKRFHPVTLFPNLCALDFEAVFHRLDCSTKLFVLRQFISPGLEALQFDVPDVLTHEAEQLFAVLPAEAYNLRQLSIWAGHGNTPFTVPPILGKLPKLMMLTIFAIDVSLTRQTITNIQHAWCLKTLRLTLCGTSFDKGDTSLELPSLENLYLSGDSLPQCAHFVRQITTRQLSCIDITYYKSACSTIIAPFIESLSKSCQNPGFLKQIWLADASIVKRIHAEPAIPLSSEIFRPLLKFNKLLSVKFIGIGNYSLDDEFIRDVAVAWPSIQELKFAASRRRADCTVSFTAMMSLASRCKSLHTLHLTFDATRPTIIPRASDGTEQLWPTQTALHKLHLGYSVVSPDARIPYFLSEVFPNLLDFDWYQNLGGIHDIRSPLRDALYELRVLRNLFDPDDEWDQEDDLDPWNSDEDVFDHEAWNSSEEELDFEAWNPDDGGWIPIFSEH
ncbi:uncharacterized protein EDB93DRAFT_1107627 [Suillus bovinus]|uniref:uncharacterized protein n=1 Tax=Suillus bovinus TaxID=48563 RepID=UPI001B87C54F|nr:uncharacterized protein EDB93DRAFT_1107627 [Suillus bovinus]KAG2133246.1 hypothetical protein EDB93DRAFT_1107627 [Suillus bovinus]